MFFGQISRKLRTGNSPVEGEFSENLNTAHPRVMITRVMIILSELIQFLVISLCFFRRKKKIFSIVLLVKDLTHCRRYSLVVTPD